MKGETRSRRLASFGRYLDVLLIIVCAFTVVLTIPRAASAHNNCYVNPFIPPIYGSYPNQYSRGETNISCLISYSGAVRLSGLFNSNWYTLAESSFSGNSEWSYYTLYTYCNFYHYVRSFAWANFAGHVHSNQSDSAACNFP
jgi:hypothetical protein